MKFTIPLLFAIFLSAGCANSQTQKGFEDVDAKTFKVLVDGGKGIVLDVRTPEEVANGVIPNAVHIDIYKNDFESRINRLDKKKEVYVYCHAGGRSADATKILLKNGFTKVYNLESGIVGWKKIGYPLVTKG